MSEATPATGGQGAAAPAAPAAAPSTAAALSAPAAAPAVPTSQQLAPPATPAANPSIKWLGDGADEETVGYVANKGWDDPKKAVQSYQHLEKLLGADKAGNAIVVPKADADAKEWDAVWNKLGRPSDSTGYKVPVPEGGDKAFQDSMLKEAHALGMPKAMAEGLFNKFNEAAAAAQKAQAEAAAAQFQKEDSEIKGEWGAAYTQNLAQAQAAMRAFGLDGATVDKISSALGHKATLQLLQQIGSKTVESDFVGGDGRTAFGNVMTPAQAKSAIKELQSDKGFSAKYLAGDADAKAKMARLHEMAFPA